MALRSFRPAKRRTAAAKPRAPRRAAPAPGVVVDAVLRFSDVQQDLGCGRTLMRMSPQRLRDPEVRTFLGDDADRAGQVSILWNEREGEIIQVLEGARLAA